MLGAKLEVVRILRQVPLRPQKISPFISLSTNCNSNTKEAKNSHKTKQTRAKHFFSVNCFCHLCEKKMFKLGSLFKLTSQRETSCDDDFMSASSLQRRKNGLAGLTSPSAAVEHKTIKFSTNKGDFEYTGTCILNSETFHGSGTMLYPNGMLS